MFDKKNRPKIRPPRKYWDMFFESIAVTATVAGVILVVQAWSGLPQTIPTHFNAMGVADGWGPKGMIWLLPAISVVMVPMMLFLRRYPWLSNVPIKITDKNAQFQYALIVRLLSFLACVVSLLFFVLVWDTISIAVGGFSLLGWWFLPVFISPIVGCLIWYFIAAFQERGR